MVFAQCNKCVYNIVQLERIQCIQRLSCHHNRFVLLVWLVWLVERIFLFFDVYVQLAQHFLLLLLFHLVIKFIDCFEKLWIKRYILSIKLTIHLSFLIDLKPKLSVINLKIPLFHLNLIVDKFNSNHFWLKSDHTEQDYHRHGQNVLRNTINKDTPILIYNKIRYFHYLLHK
jgi:hypothetical protein